MRCGMAYDARDDTTSDDLSFIPFLMDRSHWVDTRQMAKKFCITYCTLHKFKAMGVWTKGHHFALKLPCPKAN